MTAYKAVHGNACSSSSGDSPILSSPCLDRRGFPRCGPAARRLFGAPREIARQIQHLTREELGLSCSIGCGPTQSCSPSWPAELEKPGGLTILTETDVHGRLRGLPVGALSGIGPVSAGASCSSLGIRPHGQLQDAPLTLLENIVPAGGGGARSGARLGGSDSAVHAPHGAPKSLGHEVTFASRRRPTADLLAATLLDLADHAASELAPCPGYACRTLAVKLRDDAFPYTEAGSAPARADHHHHGDLRSSSGVARTAARAAVAPCVSMGLTLSGLTRRRPAAWVRPQFGRKACLR